jgi:2-pyrone-4,6-dicarboxylate lactonase
VWGTDWPHPRPEGPVPDAARLRDVFLDWTRDPDTRQAILTDNPARLYDFPKI